MSTRSSLVAALAVSLIFGGYFGAPFFSDRARSAAALPDRTVHLPGETSAGHYQIEIACKRCHTPFGGVKNGACTDCHGEALARENDSHPVEKFADPRNADRIANVDVMACVTCHREHVPDRTRPGGVTIPPDFCVACHEDVFTERPTHQGLARDGCTSAGCHNFHDNRALYEDFLKKHLHEPDQLPVAKVPARSEPRPVASGGGPLAARDGDAPPEVSARPELVAEWERSAHARAGVNCSGCHQQGGETAGRPPFRAAMSGEACAGCHASEHAGFRLGRHGMRLAVGLSPMKPSMARLPMKAERLSEELGCGSCHRDHLYDTRAAAVEACLGCHDDEHSKSFLASPHARLWQLEREGKVAPGAGVSCATCHLPRVIVKEGGGEQTRVVHDQNENLRPNDKMVRSVCLSCHGLGFSLDALADRALIRRNFDVTPSSTVASLRMAEQHPTDKKKEKK